MARNVSVYAEHYFFDPLNPSVYWGWVIRFGDASEELKVAHFTDESKLDEMVREVASIKGLPDEADPEMLAALSLIYALNEDDDESFDLIGLICEDLGVKDHCDSSSWTPDQLRIWDALRAIAKEFA